MAAFSSASSAYIRFSFTSLRLEFLQPLAAPHLPGSPGNESYREFRRPNSLNWATLAY